MSSIITASFACLSNAVSADRIGTTVTLEFESSVFDPPKTVVSKRSAWAGDQSTKYTFAYGKRRTCSITIPYITEDERPYYQEFIDSVIMEGQFTINAVGLPGVDELLSVRCPDSSIGMKRNGLNNNYSLSFNLEVID